MAYQYCNISYRPLGHPFSRTKFRYDTLILKKLWFLDYNNIYFKHIGMRQLSISFRFEREKCELLVVIKF